MNEYAFRKKALIAINSVLAAMIALGILFSPSSESNRAARRDVLSSAEKAASIRILGSEAVSLKRSGAGWVLEDDGGVLPAESSRIEAFLQALDDIESLERVSVDSGSRASLGLDEATARVVEILDSRGLMLSHFLVGNYAQAPGEVYIAFPDEDEAYSVDSGIASYILGKRSSWLNLRVWSTAVSVDDIQSLEVAGVLDDGTGDTREISYSVVRSGREWKSGETVMDASAVEASLRAIAALRGDDYAPSAEPAGEPSLVVTLELASGEALRLDIEAKRADGKYPITSSQRSRRLYLPAWALTEAVKPLEALSEDY